VTILTDDYILLKEYYFQNHHRKRCLQSKSLKVEPLFCRYKHNSDSMELTQEEIDFLKENKLCYLKKLSQVELDNLKGEDLSRFYEFDRRLIKVVKSLW